VTGYHGGVLDRVPADQTLCQAGARNTIAARAIISYVATRISDNSEDATNGALVHGTAVAAS